jgi:hypothetical protein
LCCRHERPEGSEAEETASRVPMSQLHLLLKSPAGVVQCRVKYWLTSFESFPDRLFTGAVLRTTVGRVSGLRSNTPPSRGFLRPDDPSNPIALLYSETAVPSEESG